MMRIEKTVKIFKSFKEQEEADLEYWQKISGEEKMRIVEEMRKEYIRLHHPEIKSIEKFVRIRKLGEN
ncbi:MAG: hypothetical protein WCA84_13730 [Ignavibacteriaceae bacterium]|jgi:hypothetical protein